jgi:S-(hydroxymethyl)glutathione dehydrogenase / alcohol dehydrogenase
MTEHAAVYRAVDAPLVMEEITLSPIREDQARVRIAASGVCHSDLSILSGLLPVPPGAVLGHEGAGIVEEVGAAVSHVAPGDHVVLSWIPSCGQCWWCQAGEVHLCERAIPDTYRMPYATDGDGKPLIAGMGVASFGTATNALGRALVKIDPEIPLDVAALVGCAVATGAGAAMNTAAIKPGSTVAVVGLGGVGMSVVLGAVLQGASEIIVVDPVAGRRGSALAIGGTAEVDPAAGDLAEGVKALTGGRGADYVFEVVGRAPTITAAYGATRRGGTTVIVGAAAPGTTVSFDAFRLFLDARTVVGCQYGSTNPATDFPLLLTHWREGRMALDQLVTRRISLPEVNSAFDDMRRGEGIRTVIVNDLQGYV